MKTSTPTYATSLGEKRSRGWVVTSRNLDTGNWNTIIKPPHPVPQQACVRFNYVPFIPNWHWKIWQTDFDLRSRTSVAVLLPTYLSDYHKSLQCGLFSMFPSWLCTYEYVSVELNSVSWIFSYLWKLLWTHSIRPIIFSDTTTTKSAIQR